MVPQKWLRKKIVNAYGRARGSRVTVLRFASIYGPGEIINRAIPNFIKVLDGQQPEVYGDGRELRAFIHVDDAVWFAVEAINGSGTGTFNIANNRPVSIRSVADAVIEIAGVDVKPLLIPRTGSNRVDYVYCVKGERIRIPGKGRFCERSPRGDRLVPA